MSHFTYATPLALGIIPCLINDPAPQLRMELQLLELLLQLMMQIIPFQLLTEMNLVKLVLLEMLLGRMLLQLMTLGMLASSAYGNAGNNDEAGSIS